MISTSITGVDRNTVTALTLNGSAPLKNFGLQAHFVMIGSVEKLKQQIDLGRHTVGYLHHGTPQSPSGGGHYCLCVGYEHGVLHE